MGTSLWLTTPAIAQIPQTEEIRQNIIQYSDQSHPLEQVTNVNQLRDVSPGDWAFEALRNLVERYGCIAGYPSGVYRGNRAMTRYEFAAGLNACLGQIERLIASSTADFITRDDLATLEQLVSQFEAELNSLGLRVDDIASRVAILEDNQFSTTTKLQGEAIFALVGAFGEERSDGSGNDIANNITFSDRVFIDFHTSFTGKDLLYTSLEAGNIANLSGATGTDTARLAFDADFGNNVIIDDLEYKFSMGDRIIAHVGIFGFTVNNVFNVHNPFFASSGSGALSRLGRRNPLIYNASSDAGVTLEYKFSDNISLSGTYLATNANSPDDKDGLFNGAYTTGAQLDLQLFDTFDLGITYLHTFEPAEDINLSGGTVDATRPFGVGVDVATATNRYGIAANWRVSQNLNVGGWVGYVDAEAQAGSNEGADADIWTWSTHLAFPDFGKEGNVLGFIFGMPPRITDSDVSSAESPDTSYILEVLYKYKVNQNILITPGAYVIFNPEHNDNNDTIWVGVVRTTFNF